MIISLNDILILEMSRGGLRLVTRPKGLPAENTFLSKAAYRCVCVCLCVCVGEEVLKSPFPGQGSEEGSIPSALAGRA